MNPGEDCEQWVWATLLPWGCSLVWTWTSQILHFLVWFFYFFSPWLLNLSSAQLYSKIWELFQDRSSLAVNNCHLNGRCRSWLHGLTSLGEGWLLDAYTVSFRKTHQATGLLSKLRFPTPGKVCVFLQTPALGIARTSYWWNSELYDCPRSLINQLFGHFWSWQMNCLRLVVCFFFPPPTELFIKTILQAEKSTYSIEVIVNPFIIHTLFFLSITVSISRYIVNCKLNRRQLRAGWVVDWLIQNALLQSIINFGW